MAASLKNVLSPNAVKVCLNRVKNSRPVHHKNLARHHLFPHPNVLASRTFSAHINQETISAVESAERSTSTLDHHSKLAFTLQHEDYFQVKELVSLKDLFNARVHLGHNCGLRHSSMEPYIFGTRQGTDIIDLELTLPLLHHALNVCSHIVYRGGMVLFLSRNSLVLPWVERMARDVGEYSHCRTWKKGTFTDASSTFGTLPIFPELCIFFNTQDSLFQLHRGVTESSKMLIPSIAVLDTNCDSSLVTYPIPGNDDTPVSQHFFIELFRTVVLRAKQKRIEDGIGNEH